MAPKLSVSLAQLASLLLVELVHRCRHVFSTTLTRYLYKHIDISSIYTYMPLLYFIYVFIYMDIYIKIDTSTCININMYVYICVCESG